MAEKKFTQMQQAAIDIRDRNILVSAAAGSGKTAVLVQRIIDRILDENNPIDIDRILVMTFTRAAAAQMKERILEAINKKKSENPQDKNLSKQYALVHNAYIMTIDSFCMNVVRNHFEEIGLSPDFRMADEGEIKLLQKDVLEEVIEESYEECTAEFLEMTEIFSSKKTDTAIEELVLSLYNYASSYADPEKWLEKCENKNNENNREWLEYYTNVSKREFAYLREILDEAADICTMELGPRPYLQAIEADISFLDSFINFNTYDEFHEKCSENADYAFEKLGRVTMPKGDDVSEAEIAERTLLKDRAKSIRDKYKAVMSDTLALVSSMSPENINAGMAMMSSPVAELVGLAKRFLARFDEKKRDMNIVDFNDIEHMCLEILRKGKDTTALEYKEFFEEIYIDEYQDSNFVQEEIVNLIAKNVFMVGDVKQSIYGFRNAKPEIFIDKYERFSKDLEDSDVRIDLSHNFRSREEVILSVNSVFKEIMTKEYGGISYDDAAMLRRGREFPDSDFDYTTEMNLLIADPDVPDKEAEALMVANKIKELMRTGQVEESEGGTRPIRYSDIVILLRTTKGWDNVFQNVLDGQGIPVYVAATTGYFETYEIKTLLNFLKVIDNPLQDIPLAAVMTSIIGNFYEEEVAVIRASNMNGYLYDALEGYSEEDTPLYEKIKLFKALLNMYRRKSQYMAVSDILTEIIDGKYCDYGKVIKAMPGGQKKYANLNMLLKKAIEYGKTSYKGIFQFNRYIEAIRQYDIDFGEANLSDETDNAVRIMSIHKSKGLEFPVCFLSGMGKKFNVMDTNATVLTDSKYGIATDIVDISRRVKSKSMHKICVAKKKRSEIIAEELRLLYVAMTRAKEKLIMTGTVKSEDEFRNSLTTLDKAGTYLDMLFAASEHGNIENIDLTFKNVEDLTDELVEEAVNAEVSRQRLLQIIDSDEVILSDQVEKMRERINYVYPYVDKGSVKLSVSELKHMSDVAKDAGSEEDADNTMYLYDEDRLVEAELKAEEKETVNRESEAKKKRNGSMSGAEHGSAVHRVFEIWDYSRETTRESVEQFINYIEEELLLEERFHGLVRIDEVLDFINSDIALRMKAAFDRGQLYREQPFVMSDDENDPDSMLVQGVVDAFFIEDNEIVIVDYKTDKNTTPEKLKAEHGVQLGYYGRAVARLLHLNLKESVIYSTFLGESITI